MKIVLEPVFEADMLACSFGFRPRRARTTPCRSLIDEAWRGRRWVVETDIANCFAAIPHDQLMQAVEERVCDQSVLKLLRVMLRAGVMEDGQVRRRSDRNPAGWGRFHRCCATSTCTGSTGHGTTRARGAGAVRRRSDGDVQVPEQAEAALARLRNLLAELGLEPKEAKTRIVHLEVGGEGLDFLGFHHRLVRSRGDRARRSRHVPGPLARGQGHAARP